MIISGISLVFLEILGFLEQFLETSKGTAKKQRLLKELPVKFLRKQILTGNSEEIYCICVKELLKNISQQFLI